MRVLPCLRLIFPLSSRYLTTAIPIVSYKIGVAPVPVIHDRIQGHGRDLVAGPMVTTNSAPASFRLTG